MNKTILTTTIILLVILAVTVVYLVMSYEDVGEKNNTTIKENQEQQKITEINPLVTEHEFTVNMEGNTKHGNILTISGTVTKSNSSITGIMYNEGEKNTTIVTVFQLTSDDDGFYTHDIIVNDDYLWKQEGRYIISIQNVGIYKEIQFHRNW